MFLRFDDPFQRLASQDLSPMACIIRFNGPVKRACSNQLLLRPQIRKSFSFSSGPTRIHRSNPWKPAVFTIMVGGVSYSLSGIYVNYLQHHGRSRLKSFWTGNSMIRKIRKYWWEIGPFHRFFASVATINAIVFLMWRIPAFQPVMIKYFLSRIENKGSLHLLLSSFSHFHGLHLAVNMLVLFTFVQPVMTILGDKFHSINIVPFYLTAGAFAASVSHYFRLLRGNTVGSLGASGAIIAMFAAICWVVPSTKVSLIFLPFFTIPGIAALGGVAALDVLGLIRGWTYFDHAGHLGGVIFALLYWKWLRKIFHSIQMHAVKLKLWKDS